MGVESRSMNKLTPASVRLSDLRPPFGARARFGSTLILKWYIDCMT